MGDKLPEWGLAVQWNTELTGLEQDASRVTATLKQPDGTARKVTAAWVGGCDGARSAVRELCRHRVSGRALRARVLRRRYGSDGDAWSRTKSTSTCGGEGFHLFFPMRGQDHWRVVGILPPDLRDKHDATFDDVIPSILHEAGSGLALQGVHVVFDLSHLAP